MKKLALITTAAMAAAIAAAPAAQAAPEQYLKVKLTKTKASKKTPTTVGITIDTGTVTKNADGSKNTITSAKIDLPKGILLNYKKFPTCKEATTCADSAPTSQVGTGTAAARVDGVDYVAQGKLTAFIGAGANLFIRTQFSQPAVIDEPLTGAVTTKGGAYSFGFKVPDTLQMPIPDAYQQIDSFKLNFAAKTVKSQGKKIGLVQLKTCTGKKYTFKGTFTFRDGSTATAEDTIKCTQAKK
ncbi:MAG: hypothetical protein J7513_03025 [Solirubrobacteraceae bacterium]|nr:hypothetical protein [Solirubrobacteraceae bacterium]